MAASRTAAPKRPEPLPETILPAPHLLIAGAGIGGLTAAIALARRGIAVTVIEKRPGFGELGAGLQISPNAGGVLDGLDLTLPLKRVAVTAERLSVRRWGSGREIGSMPMDVAEGSAPFRMAKRSDLHTVLLDAARAMPNIRLIVGRAVEAIEETEIGVTATLVNAAGQPDMAKGLGIVGADGLWSTVREAIGDRSVPDFTGYEAWRTVLPAGQTPRREVTLYLGRHGHAVHYPVAGGREINLVILRPAEMARPGWSREGEASDLLPHLARAASELRRLAESAPGWQIWSLYDRPPAAMARGRVALLGDAAHPILPFLAQGAAMAIEDAGVLARLLAEKLSQAGAAGVAPALSAYAAARRERVAKVQQASRANAKAYHLGWPLSLGRDFVMRRLGPAGMRARYDWLYDWQD